MSTLVSPRSSAKSDFFCCQNLLKIYFGVFLLVAFTLATTACSTLSASGSPSIASEPIAMSANFPAGTVGSAYNAVISVSGGVAPYHFSTRAGELPPGLALNATTGTVAGTPKLMGKFSFTVSVTDKESVAEGVKTFLVNVQHPVPPSKPVSVEISPSSVTIVSGTSHQFMALVSNASTPAVKWSASGGSISSSGMFTAPKINTSTTFHLTATSTADPTKSATAIVNVDLAQPPATTAALALTSTSLPDATEGTPYTAALQASGGKTPYHWSLQAGSLPGGFSFDAGKGTINGITRQAGAFNLTAAVTDAAGQTVSRKLALSVSTSTSGNFDGPAELPRAYMNSSLADTPAPGTVHRVSTAAAFQATLNSAKCGDTIALQAGTTFTGSFVFPSKPCDDNHWIVVRTSTPDSALPPEGTRLTPCYAGVGSLPGRPAFNCSSTKNVMAKIAFNETGSGPIVVANGANHYRLIGLEITRSKPKVPVYNLIIQEANGSADHIVVDRSWLHGTAQDETTRGIVLSGYTNVAIVDSTFSDFHCVSISGACGDSQAIAGGIGDRAQGTFKIVNNYLEAAGENIILGGGPATVTPTDIEIRHNFFFKPLTWMKGDANFVGGTDGHAFIVKNLFELKNAERVLLEGNVLQNNWGGFTQIGFAMLLTPKNPGNCTVCKVRDVTVRYNTFSHTGAAMQIGNGLSDNGFAGEEGSHYSIHDLVFDDLSYTGCQSCAGVMVQLTTTPKAADHFWLHDVSINHITVATNRAKAGWAIAGPAGQQNFEFSNSIVDSGVTANMNAGGGAVECYFNKPVMIGVLDSCWSHYTFTANVLMDAPGTKTWPAGNFVPQTTSSVGFVNWKGGVGGDYHLSAASPYRGKASDGKDPGADIDAVTAATVGVR
jgi:putative Ig domain-containing protein